MATKITTTQRELSFEREISYPNEQTGIVKIILTINNDKTFNIVKDFELSKPLTKIDNDFIYTKELLSLELEVLEYVEKEFNNKIA